MEGFLKFVPINWGLLKYPTNWITIILMLIFACIVIDLGMQGLNNISSKQS